MGVDLTLAIDRHYVSGGPDWFLAYDRISVSRNYKLFDAINNAKAKEIPDSMNFDWYDDEGIKRRKLDKYGAELTYMFAPELAEILLNFSGEGLSPRDKALRKYLEALPETTMIVLWWH